MEVSGGYKTRQRELILEFLTENKQRHLSADDVADHLRAEGSPVGKSTVYRCLDRLVGLGTVRKYLLEDGSPACYQFCEGDGCVRHFHLKCTGCGALLHVECEYLVGVASHVLEHHGFQIDNTKTVLYGLCQGCTAQIKGDSHAQ